MKSIKYIILLIIFSPIYLSAQRFSLDGNKSGVTSIKIDTLKTHWVDSVFNAMTIDQKIGQIFMLRAHSNKTFEYQQKVKSDIEKYQVGGVCFFQGGPLRQIDLINEYQGVSKLPMFIAIDGEWGIGMRLDSSVNFPRQMTLGAINNNDELLFEIGKAIGDQCKAVGVNIDFAPVVDVNSNSENPVINSRSFGENPFKVAQKATLIAQGMQDEGIFACAKHFPGHGDTKTDSHKTLPIVNSTLEELNKIHLYPFKKLINNGINSIMAAHLFVPALDTAQGRASSLSPIIINDLLVKTLNFKGLVFTDALEMNGVSNYFQPGELELMALKAGNDILLLPPDIEKAINRISLALITNEIDSTYFADKIKKILAAKYDLGLNMNKLIPKDRVYEIINSPKNKALINNAYKEAITLIVNKDNAIPLTVDEVTKYAIVSVGADECNEFSNAIDEIQPSSLFSLEKTASQSDAQELLTNLKDFDYVIINIMGTNNSASLNYDISQTTVDFVNLVCQNNKVILLISGNPYAAGRFLSQCEPSSVIITYEDNSIVRKISANSIFGINTISGKLPVSISELYKEGHGIVCSKAKLKIANPEDAGFIIDSLQKIDTIVQSGINHGAYPGCQVLIAKDGNIFYNKNFGSFTYDNITKVSDSTIYDLASLTKILATTSVVMRLYKECKIDIDMNLGHYLPALIGTNKENIVIRDVMAHQARLQPWIPFYAKTMADGKLDTNLYRKEEFFGYCTKVADSLYVIDSYKDTILRSIALSPLLNSNRYKYSDIGMYLLKEIIENITHVDFEYYCDSVFYNPLGMKHTVFNPLNKFSKSEIAPTEKDTIFRKQQIVGYVHDPGAALLGGVSGHAGLFSTASDIAIMLEMFLQQGNYDGKQYIDSAVLEEFTSTQFPLNNNRRALGFDKPLPQHENGGPSCPEVSAASYGHSGFTGTYFWVDPQYNLIYIFLSNRVYPNAENKKLGSMDIRTKIEKEIYNQMGIKR